MARSPLLALVRSLLTRPARRPAAGRPARLGAETLEARDVPSVATYMSGDTWVLKAEDYTTNTVALRQVGSNFEVKDLDYGVTWTKPASAVKRVEYKGGSYIDRFESFVTSIPVTAAGNGGDDYLKTAGGADRLLGGDGNDTLTGGAGDDYLNGGFGTDTLRGDAGRDTLIAFDGGTADNAAGGTDIDVIWVDQTASAADVLTGIDAGEQVEYVKGFKNAGADLTPNGDRIPDPMPKSGAGYWQFTGKPLFGSAGPRLDDIDQGRIGDCWVLAGLGAIAKDNPYAIRQRVVDFADGTYGVRLGNNLYRVDADLPVYGSTTDLVYARFGTENSLWVAVVEKAYTHYRTGANTYASIESGWSIDANKAFGSTTAGEKSLKSYASATALANDLTARLANKEAVTVGFAGGTVATGAPLVNRHMYTVASVTKNSAGTVTAITLRNPWAVDGVGSDGKDDGYVTVTPAQLFKSDGRLNWGKV